MTLVSCKFDFLFLAATDQAMCDCGTYVLYAHRYGKEKNVDQWKGILGD